MAKIYESLPTFQDEYAHEREMKELGKNRTSKRRTSHIQREEESVTSYGKVMVAQTIRPLANSINDFLNTIAEKTEGRPEIAYLRLCEVEEPEISALITAKHVINTVTQQKPFTGSCIALGGKVETQVQLKNFQKLNPELYEAVKTDLDKRSWHYAYKRRKLRESAKRGQVEWTEWSKTEKLHVGIRLVELMCTSTGLIEIGHDIIKRKKTKVIRQTQKTAEWISKRNNFNDLLNPEYLPCVMKPKEWTGVEGGAYWTSEMPPLDLVKQKNKRFKQELENFQMPEVYNAVNTMQNTPFKINTFVLDVMNHAWDNGHDWGGMPSSYLKDLPNKPHDIDTNAESRKEYKKQASIIHTENNRTKSKRILFSKILHAGQKFREYEKIYYPLQMDFRGRVYCVPAFLNYQSIGGAKALLEFSTGKPITTANKGVFWLAVHGANTWGEDKVSLADRHQWVVKNEDWIVACGDDPIANLQWNDADSPYQFLAFCNEWKQYKEQGEGYVSHIPVAVDGSCNGLQLYSLMLKDEKAGELVNLTVTDKPQDIYQVIADNVKERLRQDATNGKPYAQAWLNYGVKRSTTKRSIMTICYGSTRFSCTDFVREDLQKRKDKGEPHPFTQEELKPSVYLAGLIWESIGDNLQSAREGMDFLQAIARVVCKDQLPIHWINPVGFPIWQSYPEVRSMRVKAMLMGEVIKPRVNTELDTTDRRRMVNGVAANFVHSLDSACMMVTVNLAQEKGIQNFCNVHDSFGTTAADVHLLNETLRDAFVKVFTENDVLADFKNGISELVPEKNRDKLPELPRKGKLDVELLRQSEFFFA
jgi:DNA-directed RNA polymerase